MPTRVIRDGILDSDAVNSLDPAAEVFYRRLMNAVDDFGRFDGRPAILLARLFALQMHRVSEADVVRWLGECVAAGLVATYSVGGRPYLLYRKFGQHIRAKSSKYPAPPPDIEDAPQPHRTCSADASQPLNGGSADAVHPRSEAETETETISDSPEPAEPASGPTGHVDPTADEEAGGNPSPGQVVMSFSTVGREKRWYMHRAKIGELSSAFPHLDIIAECRKAQIWLKANPSRRKTAKGMMRFLFSWMSRAQENGRGAGLFPPAGHTASDCTDF
ncbi:MAG: hypothetical protein U0871_13630 [Gemmataceae bacterium]